MNAIAHLFERSPSPRAAIGLVLAVSVLFSSLHAQVSTPTDKSAPSPVQAASAKAAPHSRYSPSHFPKKASAYYSLVWGVDTLSVRAAESGSLLRFSYRIVDPRKAALFNDKKFEAFLDSPSHGIRLVIPSLEKVGQLRNVTPPEAGNSYWMAFSNPKRTVKKGDRVNVLIGNFHADGLIVE